MAITRTKPEIPATPGLPHGVPTTLPAFLATGPLSKLAAEFGRLASQYASRAEAHRQIANPAALNAAVQQDDLDHALAVRNGEDDPGPVNVTAWRENEETARRAVAGSRDAIKLAWADLLEKLADEDAGGKLLGEIEHRRDDARARLAEAVEQVRSIMAELDMADDEATFARRAHEYAIERVTGHKFNSTQARMWPQGAVVGQPKPIILNARPEPSENVLATLAAYRQG
ncbi:hypothetical protein CLV30_11765 [Haloactinopolyspora alba]|uniref:Uncharacterized protein n=1 Tax=Haloactinopolyspora alba TaxID=648780 RepID=A0A2P8DRB8_9ACTN|nr:hypothetical protein [Haloactinopolyspora alba]PSK99762.1 hypothetical protein CLV30_11765 [Haloactinopolyspora alba]